MSEMFKFTIEEATVLTSFGYEMEDDEYVLCYPKGDVDKHTGDVITTLLSKGVLFKDGLEEKHFWIRQNDYRVLYDLTDGFKNSEGKILKNTCMARAKARKEAKEAQKPTKVAWQDLMLQEFKDLITVEGLSMDAAREEMHFRMSELLDKAQTHFLKLILNSKLSDL